MKCPKNFDRKDCSIIVQAVTGIGIIMVYMLVLIKSISVLFKLGRALDIYLEEHTRRRSRPMTLNDYFGEDEEVSL